MLYGKQLRLGLSQPTFGKSNPFCIHADHDSRHDGSFLCNGATVRPGCKESRSAKEAGQDTKQAAQDTTRATKKTAKKAGHGVKNTKKTANKSARKTKEGAQKVEDKTQPQ
jgi:hypothetical protein